MRLGGVALGMWGATAPGEEGTGTRGEGAVEVDNLALGRKRTRGRGG